MLEFGLLGWVGLGGRRDEMIDIYMLVHILNRLLYRYHQCIVHENPYPSPNPTCRQSRQFR